MYIICVFVWWYRGYRQRVVFRVKQAEKLEQETKQKLVEDFAKLVMRQMDSHVPFPREDRGMLCKYEV